MKKLNKFIRTVPASRNLGERKIGGRIHISLTWHFAIYRVPKSANSTLLQTIASRDPEIRASRWKDRAETQNAKRNLYMKAYDLGPIQAYRMYRSCTKISTARNPYSRALSAYLEKVVDPGKKRSIVTDALGKNLNESVTFFECVNFLQNGGLFANIHWVPQSCLMPPEHAMDYVVKLETMQSEIETVVRAIFPEAADASVLSDSAHATAAAEKVSAYYCATTREIVARLYHDDFLRFDYAF